MSVETWTCGACGVECQRERTRGQRPKWCEECRRRGARAWNVCGTCGERFLGAGSKFCSLRCRPQSKRASRELVYVPNAPAFTWLPPQHPVLRGAARHLPRHWSVIVAGPCAWCGVNFVSPTGGVAAYCSTSCARSSSKQRRGKRFLIRPATRLAIYERDEWTCQLCMEPVDQDLMTLDPYGDWAPSLDHIVPQSRGGTHDAENLRLAHRWCNAVRGNETYYTEADLRPVA